jgi:hypothetical protein
VAQPKADVIGEQPRPSRSRGATPSVAATVEHRDGAVMVPDNTPFLTNGTDLQAGRGWVTGDV